MWYCRSSHVEGLAVGGVGTVVTQICHNSWWLCSVVWTETGCNLSSILQIWVLKLLCVQLCTRAYAWPAALLYLWSCKWWDGGEIPICLLQCQFILVLLNSSHCIGVIMLNWQSYALVFSVSGQRCPPTLVIEWQVSCLPGQQASCFLHHHNFEDVCVVQYSCWWMLKRKQRFCPRKSSEFSAKNSLFKCLSHCPHSQSHLMLCRIDPACTTL